MTSTYERTFVFVSDTSESDSDGEVVFEQTGINGNHVADESRDQETSAVVNGSAGRKSKRGKGRKEKSQGLEIGPGELLSERMEEVAHHQKRNKILFQLICSSAVIMLQLQGGMSWFWNSLLLNITGIDSQTVVMWSFVTGYLSSCVLSVYLSDRLPCKWTLALGSFISLLYSAARVVPNLYFATVAAFIFGLSVTPFFSAASTQISRLADAHEGYKGGKYHLALSHFIGLTCACLNFAPTWFAILHSVIGLSEDPVTRLHKPERCGFDFVWWWPDPSMARDGVAADHYGQQPLLGAAMVSAFGGLTIAALILTEMPLPSSRSTITDPETSSSIRTRLADARFLILFPITFSASTYQVFCYTVFLQVRHCRLQSFTCKLF